MLQSLTEMQSMPRNCLLGPVTRETIRLAWWFGCLARRKRASNVKLSALCTSLVKSRFQKNSHRARARSPVYDFASFSQKSVPRQLWRIKRPKVIPCEVSIVWRNRCFRNARIQHRTGASRSNSRSSVTKTQFTQKRLLIRQDFPSASPAAWLVVGCRISSRFRRLIP